MTREAELITFADFAKLLQVSVRQIYLMADDGRLGPTRVQVGRSVRFRRREVEAWIEMGCPSREEWEQQNEPLKQARNAEMVTAWRRVLHSARLTENFETITRAVGALRRLGVEVGEEGDDGR